MPTVQIFIATYNRPLLVKEAIRSALNQEFDSFDLIVSDNSTNNETEEMINQSFAGQLIYKRRTPSLLPIDHLNAILDDVTSDYFMIFHDDDLMYPDMLRELYRNIIANDELLSVGANARIVTQNRFSGGQMLKKKYGNLLIRNRDQMVHQYLVKRGIVPLSSYLHKAAVAKKIRFNPANGGKHCDVAFMMEISSAGSLLMLQKPLMDYFISPVQDSKINNFQHRIRLINYITKTSDFKKDSYLVRRYRVVNLYYEVIQDKDDQHQITPRRKRKILKLMCKVSPFDFFPRLLIQLSRKKH